MVQQNNIKQSVGLTNEQLGKVVSILNLFKNVQTAMVFGSRAMGNFKSGSDIDICLIGNNLTSNELIRISSMLNEETNIPLFFDILHYEKINNTNIIDHINRYGIIIYTQEI